MPREGSDDDAVKIGVLTACEGTFGYLAEGSITGAELPLLRRGAKLAAAAEERCRERRGRGKACSARIRLQRRHGRERALRSPAPRGARGSRHSHRADTDRRGDRHPRLRQARPDVTFVNGTASGQSLTLLDPVSECRTASRWRVPSEWQARARTPSTSWAGATSSRSATTRPSTTHRRPASSRNSARWAEGQQAHLGAADDAGLRSLRRPGAAPGRRRLRDGRQPGGDAGVHQRRSGSESRQPRAQDHPGNSLV